MIEVRIDWTEADCVPEGTYTPSKAHSLLHNAAFTAPRGGAYNKVGFTVLADGEVVFQGRCDVKHIDEPDNDLDPIAHARRFAEWVLSERGERFFRGRDDRPVADAEKALRALDAG